LVDIIKSTSEKQQYINAFDVFNMLDLPVAKSDITVKKENMRQFSRFLIYGNCYQPRL